MHFLSSLQHFLRLIAQTYRPGLTAPSPPAVSRRDCVPPEPPTYDGSRWVLYWADALTEVAFVVPSAAAGPGAAAGAATAATEADRRRRGGPDPPVLVVWLESFDDHLTFPAGKQAGASGWETGWYEWCG